MGGGGRGAGREIEGMWSGETTLSASVIRSVAEFRAFTLIGDTFNEIYWAASGVEWDEE